MRRRRIQTGRMYGKPYIISIVPKYHVITLTELKRRALLFFWVISRLLQFGKNCDIWSRKFYQEIVVDVIKNVRKEIDGAQWSDNLVVYIYIKKNEFPGKKIFEKNWIKVTEKSTISAESFKRHLGILSSFLNVLLISCFSCCYVSQSTGFHFAK